MKRVIKINVVKKLSSSFFRKLTLLYWTLEAILKRKAEEGVRICIQLFDAPTLTLDHGLEETQRIFDAMHDKNVQVLMHASTMEHLKLWSHHEKLAIIDQKIAFVGGIDLCVNRWEDENYAESG